MKNLDYIRKAASNNLQKEIELLEWELVDGTTDIDIYIRLSQIYRLQKQYDKSMEILNKGYQIVHELHNYKDR
jgi:hypothetical protein